jgi:hypothetical protein
MSDEISDRPPADDIAAAFAPGDLGTSRWQLSQKSTTISGAPGSAILISYFRSAEGGCWPTREDSYLEACVSAAGGAADASETSDGVIDTSARDPWCVKTKSDLVVMPSGPISDVGREFYSLAPRKPSVARSRC